MAYKVIDLFAGVGGLSYGFAQDDDFEIIAANEILGSMADAYSHYLIKYDLFPGKNVFYRA